MLARAFRTLVVGFTFAFFWLGGVVLSWIILPAITVFSPRAVRRQRCQRALKRGFAFFLRFTRAARLLSVESHSESLSEPAVIIANHPCLIDVVALLARYDNVCCVVKGPMFRSLLVGNMLRLSGQINGDAGSLATMLSQTLRELEKGSNILIFPEGTRSPHKALHPFQRGAFEIAARGGVPIIPIVISCQPPALMKGAPWYRFPPSIVRYSLQQLAPINVTEGRANVRQAARNMQSLYLDKLGLTDRSESESPCNQQTVSYSAG